MKRIYAAAGAVVIFVCLLAGWWFFSHRNPSAPAAAATPVYAYADLGHVVMSHPRYSEYHRLELEYNAMVAQYQFEQWNYSRKAQAEGLSMQQFAAVDAVGTAALNQELQAKVAIKQDELNNRLKQQYDALVEEKKKTTPVISDADALKIVNLQLKLKTLDLSKEERAATEEQLQALLRGSNADVRVTGSTADEIAAAMAPYKAQAKKELEDYAQQVKTDLEGRKLQSQAAFQQQIGTLKDRPEPAVWNKEWKDKLDAKEKEMNDVKEAIMADIRDKAAAVAQEQGIDMIFSDYEGVGTAADVTDDIIAKLA